MPRASRRPLKKELDVETKEHFASLISSLKTSSEIEKFFQDFLTREEITMLTKRLMLHLMLENGYKTQEIESVLAMSKETIRVHKHIWERGGSTYKIILQKIAARETAKRFWAKVDKILKPIDLLMKSRTNMKARAKLASGVWHD